MSTDIQKNLRNAQLSGSWLGPIHDPNVPGQYGDRQTMYFNDRSSAFRQKKLHIASDFISTRIQGLYADAPTEWTPCRIRMADVVRPSSAIQREFDDYKIVIMESPQIEYLPIGAKIEAMGSIWLVWNPINISAADGSGLVRRCKATWNHYDYYGNLLQEPMVVQQDVASADAPDAQQWGRITKGYFTLTMQKNAYTEQLNVNSRMLMGKGCYAVTAYTDFLEEFTGNPDSARLVRLIVRYEEPNREIDDLENHVANGKEFSWVIQISGNQTVGSGFSTLLTPKSVRNGQIVDSTPENLIAYTWESSDESVCAVDEDGLATGISEGNAVITCTLVQNPNVTAQYAMTVAGAETGLRVSFTHTVPAQLSAYRSAEITAAVYENGAETGETVEFTLSGASPTAYTAEISGNTLTVFCWQGSVTLLTVTASYGGKSASASIELTGI